MCGLSITAVSFADRSARIEVKQSSTQSHRHLVFHRSAIILFRHFPKLEMRPLGFYIGITVVNEVLGADSGLTTKVPASA